MEEIRELEDISVNSGVQCEMNTKYSNENTPEAAIDLSVVTSKCCRLSKSRDAVRYSSRQDASLVSLAKGSKKGEFSKF